MRSKVKKVIDLIENVEIFFGLVCLGALFISIIIGVFSRYVLNISLGWPEEISTGLMIWAIFLGTAIVFSKKEHILLGYFLKFLPPRVKKLNELVVLTLIEFFLIILLVKSMTLFQTQIRIPWGQMEIPGAYYFSIPVITSGLSMLISNTYSLWDEIGNLLQKKGES